VDRPEVGAECGFPFASDLNSPGVAAFAFDSLQGLYDALERIYRLGVSLPDAPLKAFREAVHDLPRKTETERLIVQRVGQEVFRRALLAYWGGRCPLTGITDIQLLRASHIVPWAECETDEKRLDVHNGLLLSALWDAAFDAGLVSFADDGATLYSPRLSIDAVASLGLGRIGKLGTLTKVHRENLAWHRSRHAF
jgi:predicted restriction endonuclease